MSEQTHTHSGLVLASARSVETFFSSHSQYCRLATPTAVVPTCPQTGGLWDLRFFIAAGLTLWAPLNLGGSHWDIWVCVCVCVCVHVCARAPACACVRASVLALHCSRWCASEFLVSGVLLLTPLSKHVGRMWCDVCGSVKDGMNFLENATQKIK